MRHLIYPASMVLLWPVWVLGQATQPTTHPADTVTLTRDEYNQLMKRLDSVESQLRAAPAKPAVGPSQEEVDEALNDIEKELRTQRGLLRDVRPGSTHFTIVGDGDVSYTWQKDVGATFSTGIAPMVLWEMTPRFLVELGLDIGVSSDPITGDASTSVDLMHANITYEVNDYLFAGGGLFLEQFGRYHHNFDPSWINPLPDDPLVFGDRSLTPERGLGFFLGGGAPVGNSKILYNAYVTNGPQVSNTGTLNWDNFSDNNSAKGYGGRIGFQPIRQIEVGYSAQYGQANIPGAQQVDVFAQAVDAQYKDEIAPIKGTLEIRGEWAWVSLDKAFYPDSGLAAPFNNDGNGGYVLVAYRPTRVDSRVLRALEFVARWDVIDTPARTGGFEQRWTLGVDYWITPYLVFKVAYQIDDKHAGSDQNALFIQCGFAL